MIGGISYASSQIASVYSSTSKALADALTRIASGKRFQNASEDLVGFLRAKDLEADIGGYETVRENITGFKAYTSAAVTAADSIYEALVEMKELARQYAGTEDEDLKAEYAAEFNALRRQVTDTLDNTYVDGTKVTKATDEVTSVDFNPDVEGSYSMTFTEIADSLTIADFDLPTGTVEDDVQDQMDLMLTYMWEAKAFDGTADQQLNLTATIINSKQAVKSLITDIDEAEEMSKVLDLSLRQQASVAMLAQGNLAQSSLLKLYE
ncbi:MAG: hypothetical protein JXA18_02530 [Chitinispirillaceae bacterium]|nr:hypothetical protein [Chitinispirillaceae bacterium]